MSELPFGENPYLKKKILKQNSAVNSTILKYNPTSSPQFKGTNIAHKRRGENIEKDDPSKWLKPIVASSSASVTNTFTDLAKENYSAEDVQIIHSRSEPEADDALRIAIGEVFVHGLDRLAAKNKKISDLEKSNKKYKDAAKSHNSRIAELQNKAAGELEAEKKESSRLQKLLDEADAAAKKKEVDYAAALALLQARLDSSGSEAEQSAIYAEGFSRYLKSFLGAHPDYNWSIYFAPSTVEYMANFKVQEAKAIDQARTIHLAKVAAEVKQLQEAEERKAQLQQEDENRDKVENDRQASPSTIVA